MNLYLFNDNDSAATFGIGTYLRELTSALKDANIHIRIVHLHSTRPEFEIMKVDEIENWHIPMTSSHETFFDGFVQKMEDYYRNVIFLLRLHIKDTTGLIFHLNFNLCQALAKGLKTAFKCKTVATIHYIKWQLELHGNLTRFYALLSKPDDQMSSFETLLKRTDIYKSLLFKGVDRVITLSQNTKKLLYGKYEIDPGKVSYIPNGLEDVSNAKEDNRDVMRHKWHISEKELLVVFVGRLHGVKGLTYLIRSFRKVLEFFPDCRLIIAGSGYYDMYMKDCEGIWATITFTGLLKKRELYELYKIADIGVIPSFHEQCSYVAIEMMMHGIPLIASTTTGLKEMVEDGVTGLHVPVIEYPDREEIDTELLADKIGYLLQNSKERKDMGRNARKRYETLYASIMMRENMLKLYNAL